MPGVELPADSDGLTVGSHFADHGLLPMLGASTAALLLRTGMMPLVAGIAGGLVGAAAASRFLQGMLYGIAPLPHPVAAAVAFWR